MKRELSRLRIYHNKIVRTKKAAHFVQPFAIYAILLFYIAYMKQFMLSALEDTLVKLIHKRIFF